MHLRVPEAQDERSWGDGDYAPPDHP